jgi:nucleotide-binding universal stress UspA family protein
MHGTGEDNMKLICATDFSQQGRAAADMAAGLARVLGDSVCLVHVVDPTPLLGMEFGPGTGSWENALRDAAARELAQEAKRLASHGVVIESRVEVGSVVERLRALVDEKQVRLVVLGSHGRKGVAHFFVGSVAEDMARTSRCPVVVTRGFPFPEQGSFGEQRLHLAVLVDGTPGADAALAWVKGLRALIPCDVTFVQVYRRSTEEERFGLAPPPGADREYQPILRPLLEAELRRWAGELPGTGAVHFRLRALRESVPDDLAMETELVQPDLVVVGITQRTTLGLEGDVTAHAALRALKLPVVCVPESLRPAISNRIPDVRTVVVGTDLSDFANQVVPSAYALVSPGGGLVEICHVFETALKTPPVPGLVPPPALEPGMKAEMEARLARLIPPEAAARGIVTRVVVCEASTAVEGLKQQAERRNADVVVVASHARGGIKRAVLGSVASELVTSTTRAVLVLHPARR